MKELLKELVKLAVMITAIMVVFFGGVGFVVLLWNGMDFLPQYIGGFSTIMLYIAFFMMLFAILLKFSKND